MNLIQQKKNNKITYQNIEVKDADAPRKHRKIILYNYVKSEWNSDMIYSAIALIVGYSIMFLTILAVNITIPNIPPKISLLPVASISCGIFSFAVCLKKMYSDERFNKINFCILFFSMIILVVWVYMLR